MSNQIRCEQITRRGRPCRNPAQPGSDPPRCARHREPPAGTDVEPVPVQLRLPIELPPERPKPPADRPAAVPKPPGDEESAATQPYLPGFAPEELGQLELEGLSPDLRGELQTVRVVMLRLMRLWGDPAQAVSPEEARRLATLLFSGARTVAHLLSRQTKEGDGQDWLAQVLDELGGKHGLNL